MRSASKPRWQQVTTLVSLSTCGAMTGFSFAQAAVADMTSPTSLPVHLMALTKPAQPAQPAANSADQALRSAIVSVASNYLRMAEHKSPAEMEALIWQKDSVDGADHGESCAAFASLTLALGAQATGHESWVTGGSTYPWPLHDWADVRVDPNPSSLDIVSVLSDAQAHHRWHPLGDGYQPQPGDWVLFDGHVEVVTKHAGGVLYTIGADSLPSLTVNAHQFSGPFGDQGVTGFVDNGNLPSATTQPSGPAAQPSAGATPQRAASATARPSTALPSGAADVPGIPAAGAAPSEGTPSAAPAGSSGSTARTGQATAQLASVPGVLPASQLSGPAGQAGQAGSGAAAIPGASQPTAEAPPATEARPAAPPRYTKHHSAPAATQAPGTSAQQAFIDKVAPGAIAAQRKYGIPASVTIAQAIDESGWGQSGLATKDNNLFGIKGTGPAGIDTQQTQEFVNGQWVTTSASFRVYHNMAQSIADHSQLLATSGYYQHAMADREVPDAFATDLTGVYATDPEYGSKLIALMRLYNLYRYDAGAPATVPHAVPHAAPAGASGAVTPHTASGPAPTAGPQPAPTGPTPTATPRHSPGSTAPASPAPSSPAPSSPAPSGISPTGTAPATQQPPAGTAPIVGPQSPPGTAPIVGPQSPPGTAPTGVPYTPPGWTPATAPHPAPSGGAVIPGVTDAYLVPAPAVHSASPPAAHTPLPHTLAAHNPAAHNPLPHTLTAHTPLPHALTAYSPAAHNPAAHTPAAHSPATDTRAEPVAATEMADFRPMAPAQPDMSAPRSPRAAARRYVPEIPRSVLNAFVANARAPLIQTEPLYRDVAHSNGVRWELLAACDWLQCRAHPRYSPVYGEKLATVNPDGTSYRTKSAALTRCASDLMELAGAVYRIDLTARTELSVPELAKVFAAFRWGGLLKAHNISALEFPYSVAGLTARHLKMHWPDIDEPNPPDKPGTRFRMAFGAVPVVLSLGYQPIA